MELLVKLFCQAVKEVISRQALQDVGDEELTEVQVACLRFIYLHNRASVGEIATGLGISNAAATKLIDRLARKGLVGRGADPKDRRVLRLELTETGEMLVKAFQSGESRRLNELLAQMDEMQWQALRQGLTGFLTTALTKPEAVERICLKCGRSHRESCPGNQIYRGLTGKEKENV
jgi:DNA-binding MarR family transcriptional regulator